MGYRFAFVLVSVSLLLVSCVVPTATPSPLPTPTPPPSPLPTYTPEPPGPIPDDPYIPPWLVAAADTSNLKFNLSGGAQVDFSIAGISIALLIIGIVEAAKQFGITGKASMALAMGLGVLFVGLAQALTQGLIPAVAVVWIKLAVTALAGGLAAMGYYDFARRLRNGG